MRGWLIRRRAKASAGLRSAADDGKVDVCVVGSQSLWWEMLVWSGQWRGISVRLVAAALNRCEGRPVLLGRSPQRSRGARWRSAETLRCQARDGATCGKGGFAEVGFSGRKTRCVEINNLGRTSGRPLLHCWAAALCLRARSYAGPFHVCGLEYDDSPSSGRVPVPRTELRVGCTLCASLVCDVSWWRIVGVPRKEWRKCSPPG
jgi:hypothetical protein